jgi:hypothetical protein
MVKSSEPLTYIELGGGCRCLRLVVLLAPHFDFPVAVPIIEEPYLAERCSFGTHHSANHKVFGMSHAVRYTHLLEGEYPIIEGPLCLRIELLYALLDRVRSNIVVVVADVKY